MAAGTTIKHKRKAGALSNGELAAGEWGLDVTNSQWYFSINGTTVIALPSGTGGVDTANSPNANEFARFTDADTIEGRTVSETKSDLSLDNVTNESKATMFTDAALTGNPTAPTQSAGDNSTKLSTTAYADAAVAAAIVGLWDDKGGIDCSSNPNYPAASKSDIYYATVAGKIGGASGISVDAGDFFVAAADNAGGTQASVGSSWHVIERNLIGAYVAGGTDVAVADGGTGASDASGARANLGLGSMATQDASAVAITGGTIAGATSVDATTFVKGLTSLRTGDNFGAGSNNMSIRAFGAYTADRTLSITLNDATRSIDLSGNLTVPSAATVSGTNTGDQTTVSGNAGSATVLATARNIDGQSFNGSANITVIAPGTHAATGKTTPVDADELPIVDSAASNVLKKLTWANLKATLKTYFDTLYATVSHTHAATDITSGDMATARMQTNAAAALNATGSATVNTASLTIDGGTI